MRFSEVPGLEETKSILTNSVKNNHVAHAQLFFGPEGSANLSMALAYASYINCENPTDTDSCGSCASCVKMDKFIHPDMHFIFPKTAKQTGDNESGVNTDTLSVWRNFLKERPFGNSVDWADYSENVGKQLNISKEDGKHIIKTVSMKAFEAKFKVILIWLPEFMNISCANTILKVLEEPPEKTLYLMVTNDYEQLITTIISRTQLVRIPGFSTEEIQGYLENSGIESGNAHQVALMSNGSLREAKILMEHTEEVGHQLFRNWMRECWKLDILNINKRCIDFNDLNKSAQKSLIIYGLNMLRESLSYSITETPPNRPEGEEKQFIEKFAESISTAKIESLANVLNEAHFHLERNGNPRIIFLDTSMQLSGILRSK